MRTAHGAARVVVEEHVVGVDSPSASPAAEDAREVQGGLGVLHVERGVATPGYHHVAVSVDSGLVTLYFDGVKVASGDVGLGYTNGANLRIGEDTHDLGGTADEQLIGHVDEVLVIDSTSLPTFPAWASVCGSSCRTGRPPAPRMSSRSTRCTR